jgi:putative sterol carrier protein
MFAIMEIEKIRKELKEKVQKINPIGKKLKFCLDDEVILIDGSTHQNVVSDVDEEADCTIIMSKNIYLKIQRGEIKPMIATLTGKIKVIGDIGLAQKLKQLM